MKWVLFISLIILFIISLSAQTTYFVGNSLQHPDMVFDFGSINDAITTSADGDTIVVYPIALPSGYNQVNFAGKNVYVTSRYKYTGDINDIYNTPLGAVMGIGSIVLFTNNEGRGAVLDGFTIHNGIGEQTGLPSNHQQRDGGGIFIRNASPTIKNCIIQNNTATRGGGGIAVLSTGVFTSPLLVGNVIKNNTASRWGGGLFIGSSNVQIVFDNNHKNSIFSNTAPNYSDVYSFATTYMNVVLDTFTVSTVDPYYITMYASYDFSCDHWIIDQVNQDIYVSVSGNDTNSGLTQESPLKTIKEAMFRIKSNPDNRNTIHVAPGVYKASEGQTFPVFIKSDVILQGAGQDVTVIDLELFPNSDFYNGGAIKSDSGAKNFQISGMAFINNRIQPWLGWGSAPVLLVGTDNCEISDCFFENNINGIQTFDQGGFGTNRAELVLFRNLTFVNNFNNVIDLCLENATIENVKILNNRLYNVDETFALPSIFSGTPVRLFTNRDVRATYTMSNILIANTSDSGATSNPLYDMSELFGVMAMRIEHNVDVLLNNATIVYNHIIDTGKDTVNFFTILISIGEDSELKTYNSILANNEEYYIAGSGTFNINHSLLEGGPGQVLCNLVWGEGNIVTYPGFDNDYLGQEIWPYQLMASSPCIDTGTSNISNYNWLPVDILGNTRVVGDAVDMGAYEFNGSSDFYIDFVGEPRTGEIPLTVQFTDTSVGYNITSWQWDFQNDGIIDSTEQNPIFTYYTTGQTTVRLVVNNGQGSRVKHEYINPRPVAITGGSLQGVVTAGGYPLPDVIVTVVGTTLSATTNGMGIYNIVDIVAGTYSIRAEKTNYETVTLDDVVISVGETTTQHFVLSPLSESENTIVSQETKLKGNYPNPFNPETTIAFSLATAGKVEIDIYNIKGSKVKTLVNERRSAGNHQVIWDGKDDNDRNVGSGIYFYQMRANAFVTTKKMILMK